jgi:excinuclease ABC subunit A
MDVIKLADYIMICGPEGGKGGGKVVCKGTPEEIADNKSYTKFLKGIGVTVLITANSKLLSFN